MIGSGKNLKTRKKDLKMLCPDWLSWKKKRNIGILWKKPERKKRRLI